jgi:hypothetical protein
MPSFKLPSFQERNALAAKAKQDALDKIRAKPAIVIDEATLAKRREAELARDAAQAKAREERLAARELAKTLKAEAAIKNAMPAKEAAPAMTKEAQKALRDAKYAARKSRLGK